MSPEDHRSSQFLWPPTPPFFFFATQLWNWHETELKQKHTYINRCNITAHLQAAEGKTLQKLRPEHTNDWYKWFVQVWIHVKNIYYQTKYS